jgi:hypothetical protein
MYYWEAEQVKPSSMTPLDVSSQRLSWFVLTLAAGLAFADAARSFQRHPFTYAQRCLETRPLGKDGWASGTYRQSIPEAARRANVTLSWERPDVAWREVWVEAAVELADGTLAEHVRFRPMDPAEPPAEVVFNLLPVSASKRTLLIASSNCYVPLNLGVTYDPRRLGVKVAALRFFDANGSPVSAP